MTRADTWKRRPVVLRYRAYRDALRDLALGERFVFPDAGAAMVFHMPMPESWSKKKRDRMRGQPHRQKPDLDNLEKGVIDALLSEDSGVWHLAGATKLWSDEGAVEINLGGPPEIRLPSAA
jgi:hypothetical protein